KVAAHGLTLLTHLALNRDCLPEEFLGPLYEGGYFNFRSAGKPSEFRRRLKRTPGKTGTSKKSHSAEDKYRSHFSTPFLFQSPAWLSQKKARTAFRIRTCRAE